MRTTEITPSQINTEQHFWNAFGKVETEISARWIVQFCQERGQGWEPFSEEDIERFYNRHGYYNFRFNGLRESYVYVTHGQYVITPEFVERCYKASPQEL